jgi:DNA primase catalytic core
MPYVPPEVKERIKREVSVQRLAEARGIKLHRSGRSLMGLCPFHDDRNPSLSIDAAKNEWHCFGCDRKGDVIEWVKCAEGVSFHRALELLKRDYVPSAGPVVKVATVPKLPPLIDPTADDKKLLGVVVDYYNRTLQDSPEAKRYLLKRGLESSEIIDRFKLGYANRTLSLHLPASNRLAGDAQRARLKALGVIRNQTPGHEHFNGSLVVPVFNLAGDVVEMYGRKIVPNLRTGSYCQRKRRAQLKKKRSRSQCQHRSRRQSQSSNRREFFP